MEQKTIEEQLKKYICANEGKDPETAAYELIRLLNEYYFDPVSINDGIVYMDELLEDKSKYTDGQLMLMESVQDGLIWFMTECLCGGTLN